MTHPSTRRGFTLIEVLVVVSIIGLLSAIVLGSLNTARQKGRDAARITYIKELKKAMEFYYDKNITYPPGSGSTCSAGPSGTSYPIENLQTPLANPADPTGRFIGDIPDSFTTDSDQYICSGGGKNYGLLVFTEAGTPKLTESGISQWCKTGVNTGIEGIGMWPGSSGSRIPVCNF